MTAPTRPVLRWHGGKWKLAPWIISHFPPHRVYVEPFGGAGSVLLRKPRSFYEALNDLDDEIVNLFRVLRSDRAPELINAVALTPFSRVEFLDCYRLVEDPVDRARMLIVRSFMGHGSGGPFRRPTGFRANANASGEHNTAAEWAGYPECLAAIVDRLSGVVIENTDATRLMVASDRPDTLHYVDPPYVPDTRSPRARRGGGALPQLCARAERSRSRCAADGSAGPRRIRRAVRLPIADVRRRAFRLAPRDERDLGRRRQAPHGSPLAQPNMRCGARSAACRRRLRLIPERH